MFSRGDQATSARGEGRLKSGQFTGSRRSTRLALNHRNAWCRHPSAAITERYQRALEDAEGRLRLLSAHVRGIIFELDSRVRFVRVWASDPQLLALPEHELLGKTILETLGPELGQRHHEAALATVQSGKFACYEYELDVPGGHRHFACESLAVPAATGSERHAVFWIRDITEQVRLHRKLVETERLASVGVLAAGVAHEINNPLAYMLLNTEQLRSALRHLEVNQQLGSLMTSVEMIHEGAQRVQRIVRELLQLAKPDDPLEPVDVRQVVGLSLELTRTTYEHRAQVHTELEQVPRVIAHRGRLVQVFTNLLTNAAESITDGAQQDNIITVTVRHREPKTVQVEFRDTGCGIAREDVSRVFEPFFTTKERGTGLGLAICQRIVTSFNGEIRLEQGNPRGSIFQVLLPVADCTLLHDGVQR